MFQTRLMREEDALLIFETMAYMVRQSGLPARPAVPSPLHKSQGIDTLLYSDRDTRNVFDWAQDAFATVLDSMHVSPEDLTLIAASGPQELQPGVLTFDPVRTRQPGQFSVRIVLDLARQRVEGFDPGFSPTSLQRTIILLTACAYHRQGFALARCLPAVQDALPHQASPLRLIENALTLAACLALMVRRQTPEQIIATYGMLMSKSLRRKIRPACRQISAFALEVKLLQLIGDTCTSRELQRGSGRPELRTRMADQPQRISWT